MKHRRPPPLTGEGASKVMGVEKVGQNEVKNASGGGCKDDAVGTVKCVGCRRGVTVIHLGVAHA